MEIKKQSLIVIIIILWALGTTTYVIIGKWEKHIAIELSKSHEKGVQQALFDVLSLAKSSGCDAIPLNYNRESYELINSSCIKDKSLINRLPKE